MEKSFLLVVAEIKNVIYPAIKDKLLHIDQNILNIVKEKSDEIITKLTSKHNNINNELESITSDLKSTIQTKYNTIDKNLDDKSDALDKQLESKKEQLEKLMLIVSQEEANNLETLYNNASQQVQNLNIGNLDDFKKGLKNA